MKLLNIYIKGRKQIGLESDILNFGSEITELYGLNGSGKTPLIQSIAFCLGYPCKFREDIYRFCKNAQLTFLVNDMTCKSIRDFSQSEFNLEFIHNDKSRFFYSESEYSKFLFELLNLPYPSLTTTQNKQTYPYLSSILPIFYLDQDEAYSKYYYSNANYIKDQFSEMLRIVFSLPEKNSFEKKKAKIDIDAEIKYSDEALVIQRRNIELAKESMKDKKTDYIDEDIEKLKIELENLRESTSIKNDALLGIDTLIDKHNRNLKNLRNELNDLKKRNYSLSKIKNEIDIEINTLNLNEEAKRIFRSFNEICPAINCGLFQHSTDNYGKNLLYLKDQIKDIERNIESSSVKVSTIEGEIEFLVKSIHETVKVREGLIKDEGISSVVDTISKISSEIFLLQMDKSELEKIKLLEDKYFNMIKRRDIALDRKESLSNSRVSIPKLTKIKNDIRQLYIKWLDILRTPNINKNITFKDDFIPMLGTESLEQLKGSTKVRAILAYRVALIETMLRTNNRSFDFVIFDTPKQHEIHLEDIDNFMINLKNLTQEFNFQVIISSTEYLFKGDDKDKIWSPLYPGEEHKMFFKHV